MRGGLVPFDGQISRSGMYLLFAYWVVFGLVGWLRMGRFGRVEHLRDPGDSLILAPWNVLDPQKWTEDGLALHRRWLRFLGLGALSLIALILLLDALTS